MATAPLFNASVAIIRQRLRLTGVPAGSDAEQMILEGVLRARTYFYKRLGIARVAVLVAIGYVESPATSNEILRAMANIVEVKLVHAELLDTMPVLFMDGSGNAQQIWNEEGITRQGQTPEITKARLRASIEEDMQVLAGEVVLGEATSWQITTNEPDEAPPVPGSTSFQDSGSVFSTQPEGDD